MFKYFKLVSSPATQQAVADAYVPVLRGILVPATFYYLFVTYGHFKDETGVRFCILAGLSFVTSLILYISSHLLKKIKPSLHQIELLGLGINSIIYANVVTYFLIHFEETKLIYFVLMSVIFSTSGATVRVIGVSILTSLVTLYWFASQLDAVKFNQYIFIGVAGAFASLGMSALLRNAILSQVKARLRADDLARLAENRAATDTLTGLLNRRAIFALLEQIVAEGRACWFGVIDLDGFKAINDLYGHVAGDHLLREAATRLSSFEVEGMTIARIGGDEFAIVLERPITVRQIEMLGDGLIGAVRQAVSYGSQKLAVSASGGFANYPDMAADTKALYERADFALYKAKENQRGRTVVFNKENELEIREHVLIERAFREGDLENELFLMFQPQTNILTSKVVGFEALARWRSTSIGLIPPDLFIRVAEKSGYIGDITKILFRKGLQALASWPDDIRLSFNLSLHDVSNLDTIDWLIGQVKKSGLDPARIDFEITETAVMFDFELSSRALAMLVEMGAKIALDDFGSGHSSFEYIDRLPLHKIKIDKSFVAKVAHNRVSVEIVSAVLSLCRRLELDCVLEGVETTRELDVLRSLGAQLIQGYLFGRPMEGARVLESFMPIEHRLSA